MDPTLTVVVRLVSTRRFQREIAGISSPEHCTAEEQPRTRAAVLGEAAHPTHERLPNRFGRSVHKILS